MLRLRRVTTPQCAARPALAASHRLSVSLTRSIAPARAFRTSAAVFAKAEKAGGSKGKGGGDTKKVAKTGQKKDADDGTAGGAKKVKKTKEEIAAERKAWKAKAVEHKKKLAKKKRNFWDIAARYKDYGIGKTLRRSIWPPEYQTFWTVSRVNIKKTLHMRGKAWGIFTWRGKPQKEEKQIRGILKREWTIYEPIPEAVPLVEQKPSAAHIEEVRPVLHAMYGTAVTKHNVPKSRYGPLNINTKWHKLTDEERKPIPGLTVKEQHGWNVPEEPPEPEAPLLGSAGPAALKLLRSQMEAVARANPPTGASDKV